MEKIVQLREYEYNALKEKADMNQAAIDKAMEKEIKKSCNVTIELEMNVFPFHRWHSLQGQRCRQ